FSITENHSAGFRSTQEKVDFLVNLAIPQRPKPTAFQPSSSPEIDDRGSAADRIVPVRTGPGSGSTVPPPVTPGHDSIISFFARRRLPVGAATKDLAAAAKRQGRRCPGLSRR